jgi:hypothetical protein
MGGLVMSDSENKTVVREHFAAVNAGISTARTSWYPTTS